MNTASMAACMKIRLSCCKDVGSNAQASTPMTDNEKEKTTNFSLLLPRAYRFCLIIRV